MEAFSEEGQVDTQWSHTHSGQVLLAMDLRQAKHAVSGYPHGSNLPQVTLFPSEHQGKVWLTQSLSQTQTPMNRPRI